MRRSRRPQPGPLRKNTPLGSTAAQVVLVLDPFHKDSATEKPVGRAPLALDYQEAAEDWRRAASQAAGNLLVAPHMD